MPRTDNPLIVQSDKTILLEVDNERYTDARDILARFAELEKSPEYIHTYRVTPLSLWNAASSGLQSGDVLTALEEFAKYPLPANVVRDIADYMGRYGRVKLIREDGDLLLVSDDPVFIAEIAQHKKVQPYLLAQPGPSQLSINPAYRGHLKQALVQIGYPAEDLAGYVIGDDLPIELCATTAEGRPFWLRDYQCQAAEVFYAGGSARGGSGTIVLPCGAGKTMVGMAAMQQLQTSTLILSPNTVAVRQWIDELLDKTSLTEDLIGEYSGLQKDIRPVTISTYQMITYRKRGSEKGSAEEYPHFELFNARNWGLIIYDEVHLLPAPVFRITAELQARRRLGLTATLVREDGMESDVFSLIGPKKYDVPWKDLEKQGWIATAVCHEVRIPLDEGWRMEYALAAQRNKYSVAAHNPKKIDVLQVLLERHAADNLLVIGMYLDQLEEIAALLDAPLITGKTPVRERERLYEAFRTGQVRCLVVSKVANFSIDLPDANVAIEISGTFGSRQEEAQRLGRILRPKSDGSIAHFYTLVTRDTVDQTYAANRQRFLTEQGYKYEILYENEVFATA
ncbi:MAG: DEAD/DEAH box helicase [Anaerolineae bacterium]|nr:DEAD/DEAH box helicase [Anaerolineae bacterium]